MSAVRGDIWIGDLIRALEGTPGGSPGRDAAVARLLGFVMPGSVGSGRGGTPGSGPAHLPVAEAPGVGPDGAGPDRVGPDGAATAVPAPAEHRPPGPVTVARTITDPTPIVTAQPARHGDQQPGTWPGADPSGTAGTGPAGQARQPPDAPAPEPEERADGTDSRTTGYPGQAATAGAPETPARHRYVGQATVPPSRHAAGPRQTATWTPVLSPAASTHLAAASDWRAAVLPRARRVRRAPDPGHQLFAPRSSAAILHLALAQPAPDGPVEVPALIDRLARCRPVDTLPRRSTPTLRFGVDVLVDTGIGMELFDRDVRDLLRQVRRVAGAGQTAVTRFAYAPPRGAGSGPKATWGRYRPPHPRTRILILSDFGMGGPAIDYRRANADEWVDFAHQIRRHGCAAVALTPYPRRRWPDWLPALFPVVPWDRNVTVGQVAARMSGR